MNYTARINDFQICDVTYLPGLEPKEPSRNFDIVKWKPCPPHKVKDVITNEKKTITESCYSIATLVWNEREKDFEFESVGMRWLEEEVPNKVCRVIKAFADFKREEYRSLDNE